MDWSGLLVLGAATIIAAAELVLSAATVRRPADDDPCRERPSALPTWRVENE
jgi:hypothetical protein